MNILIRIAFDGNYFKGTQKQTNEKTIQGVFEDKLSNLFNQNIKVSICSRLDAKVSASDYVLTFKCDNLSNIPLNSIKKYLQDHFKQEIYIKEVKAVSESFHPRYNCKYKVYSYLIQNGLLENVYLSNHSLILYKKIDIKKVKQVMKLYKGVHDFNLFCSNKEEKNTKLEILNTKVVIKKNLIYLKFKGKSFLKYQIRFMVGAILLYCYNHITLEDIINALNNIKSKKYLKKKVDAKGLILEKIVYDKVNNDII